MSFFFPLSVVSGICHCPLCSMSLTLSDSTHKWDPAALSSCTSWVHLIWHPFPYCCKWQVPFFLHVHNSMYVCEYLERSHILATVNDTTMNTGVQISLQHINFHYYGYIHSYWIARSNDSSAFSCLESSVVFSTIAVLIYISTNSLRNSFYFAFFWALSLSFE